MQPSDPSPLYPLLILRSCLAFSLFSGHAILQRHEVQPDVYARRLGLPVPMSVSVKLGPVPNLWTTITRIVALDPASAIPRDPNRPSGISFQKIALWVGVGTLGSGLVVAVVWGVMRHYGVNPFRLLGGGTAAGRSPSITGATSSSGIAGKGAGGRSALGGTGTGVGLSGVSGWWSRLFGSSGGGLGKTEL